MTFLDDNILPLFFKKNELFSHFPGTSNALDAQTKRAIKSGKLLQLKNGLYMMSVTYIHESDKIKLAEFIASQLYKPSYISLEYALEKYYLLPDKSVKTVTSITRKTTRIFTNFLGDFTYSNIKPLLYSGFEEVFFHGHTFYMATKGKALFDYLYLNSDLDYRNLKHLDRQLFNESPIQWENFSEVDFEEFDPFVWKSNSAKMMKIWHVLRDYLDKKNFDLWAKEILS